MMFHSGQKLSEFSTLSYMAEFYSGTGALRKETAPTCAPFAIGQSCLNNILTSSLCFMLLIIVVRFVFPLLVWSLATSSKYFPPSSAAFIWAFFRSFLAFMELEQIIDSQVGA
eukprot:11401567-Ditylum_brightwellii.AAC.1